MRKCELDHVDRLMDEYLERFGVCFTIPLFNVDWTDEDTIAEITYSLETGIPLDENSPRWVWGHSDLEDGVVC